MKDIKIKGEIKKLDFEQCYHQFAPLRAKFTKKYSYIPFMTKEDIAQEIDMAFFKAYKFYNNTEFEFTTVVYKIIIQDMTKLNNKHHTQKRQTYEVQVSSLNTLCENADRPTELIDLMTDNQDITEEVILNGCIEKALCKLDGLCVEISKLLIEGLKQQEIVDMLGISQMQVSRIKRKFLKELKKELSA